MEFCICYHSNDKAALNIVEHLDKLNTSIPAYPISNGEHLIFLNNLDKKIKEDFIIFASKHQSIQYHKSLTVHSIGNFNKAEFGGFPGKLSPGSAVVNKILLQELQKQAQGSSYEFGMEVTHHGPYLEKPSCFIEIGSTEKEWTDNEGGEIIARTIKSFLDNYNALNKEFIPAIGIGATHYCPSFNKVQLQSKYALAHILPQYHIPFKEEMVVEMLDKTIEKPAFAILDWKCIGKSDDRKYLLSILEKLKIKYIKTSEVEK